MKIVRTPNGNVKVFNSDGTIRCVLPPNRIIEPMIGTDSWVSIGNTINDRNALKIDVNQISELDDENWDGSVDEFIDAMDDFFFRNRGAIIGEIKVYSGTIPPSGWAFCQGQILNISENQALYNVIGHRFGGDGIQTFALPDLRGRAIIGTGTGENLTLRTIGDSGGSEVIGTSDVSLVVDNENGVIQSLTNQENMMPYLVLNYMIYTKKVIPCSVNSTEPITLAENGQLVQVVLGYDNTAIFEWTDLTFTNTCRIRSVTLTHTFVSESGNSINLGLDDIDYGVFPIAVSVEDINGNILAFSFAMQVSKVAFANITGDKVVILDIESNHANNVKQAFLNTHTTFDANKIEIRYENLNDTDLTDVAMVIQSTKGIAFQQQVAYNRLPQNGSILLMPLGDNDNIELDILTDFPAAAIATGSTADGVNNSTAFGTGLEFIDIDESVADATEQSSYSNATVAAKLMQIYEGSANVTWEQVRQAARQTASYSDSYTTNNGFGVIDVNAAIALLNA